MCCDAIENSYYGRYTELGGIINEKDYQEILTKVKDTVAMDTVLIRQAEGIARIAGIQLVNTKNTISEVTRLYGVLRADIKPKGVQHHHSLMCDQRLFAEALRMLGDSLSLNKLIATHVHISF